MRILHRYLYWLHTQWPAGRVEKLPVAGDDGSTNIPGLYITGDLLGIPLLKFAADSGARVVHTICADKAFNAERSTGTQDPGVVDLAIVGGGVSGIAAAIEAHARGLSFRLFEASELFATIANFPKQKPIYTYPRDMKPAGALQVTADVKEALFEELAGQARSAGIQAETARAERVQPRGGVLEVTLAGGEVVRARRVVCALGQSGDFRRLGVAGEESEDKVFNRLHDPHDFARQDVLVVGGGDTAIETAIALVRAGARVTVSYRQGTFSRPKPENVEQIDALARRPGAGSLRLLLSTTVKEIRAREVDIQTPEGRVETIPNDVVFVMIGRDAPLDFFRRSGVKIRGDWSWKTAAGFAAFVAFCVALYNWKAGGRLTHLFYERHWWPVPIADAVADPASILGVIRISASSPAFWYTLAYSLVIVVFGIRRIRRRRTPYVTAQTAVLMAIQVLPLFLLPEILLPYLGKNHLLPAGLLDALFPVADYGNGREYWRAYGLILAWPLNVYNVFTAHPLPWWLAIAFVQTCVLIPLAIFFWGKGAYCGWVCSCGALAETLGDTHRTKMPHGPAWNRANAFGQGVLAVAVVLLAVRIIGWTQSADSWANRVSPVFLERYKWIVDVFLGGVVGYGFYFWFSGRVWCRFACPLAALMHVYARFSRFGIVAAKKKCISCNVCTSVCHQGIDVMSFANKGLTMQDPQCVRCSACVQSCPTGVLSFGQVDRGGKVLKTDRLAASPVRMREH